jgi:hypothetical protein
MILKLEVAENPPQLVGCNNQDLCYDCVWKNLKPICKGKRAYNRFLTTLKGVKNGRARSVNR